MLIATQSKNVASTAQYFDQVLTQGDYYLGQEINGRWQGRGAEILGLKHGSDVTKEQFVALLKGEHPTAGKQLTQRVRKDRRPGMDLTFSVPKSVSLAWAINKDERVLDALREVVAETMAKDVEPLMQRRVRNGEHCNSEQKATTGKLVYADFVHKTSRPVDGVPDPHLHVHAFVINWTEHNGKHYAGQMEEVVRQRPSLQAKFESRLARRLQNDLGYRVRQTRFAQSGRIKAGWEIDGVERSTIEKFSRRTEQVEMHAAENCVHDAAKKSTLGAKTREKKEQGASVSTLRDQWRDRLDDKEREAFESLHSGDASRGECAGATISPEKSLQYALDHHLFRQSTVERHQVIGTALEHGLTIAPEEMESALDKSGVLQRSMAHEGIQREMISTPEVLAAEKRMIDYARNGRGTRAELSFAKHEFTREWLNAQQKNAVSHVLSSRDAVIAVTGGAGTGKSSLMQEAGEAISKHGKELLTFAPSTGAKEVLQDKGFAKAQTVEHLIRNEKMHPELKDQFIWIDEAGLLDVRSMNAVFEIAKTQNARVVLSGDTRQHASPRRGEAMRLLENEAGLNIARVEAIQRQKGRYRDAIEKISTGHEIDPATGKTGLLAGFDELDRMGKIKEVDPERKSEVLAQNYFKAQDTGKSTLVVSPTHREANEVTEKIRDSLRERGQLEKAETSFVQLKSMNLTEAEKREPKTYLEQTGAVVQFHQNVAGGIKRGTRYRVAGAMGNEVQISPVTGGESKRLPLDKPDRFEVYRENELNLAVGDRVRFTLGGTAKDGKTRIANGRLDEVKSISAKGDLVLRSGHTIDKQYGHFDFGYVVTSHSAQGKDRDVAIAAMGSESLPGINARQFYVTASRGSQDVMLFVDDKARVRRAIARSGEQLSATEMVRNQSEPKAEPSASVRPRQRDQRQRRGFQRYRDRLLAWWRGNSQARPQQRTPLPKRDAVRPTPPFHPDLQPQRGI